MKREIIKKFNTVLAALVLTLVMGAASMTFAATPDATDVLTVQNVEADATVMAYQIVKEDKGQWVVANSTIQIADPKNPTAAEIATIAKNPPSSGVKLDYDSDDKTYSKSGQSAGMYLVLISGTGATVYNPMIVSIDYDGTADSVNTDSRFNATAYAKSTTPDIEKTNTESGKTASGTTNEGRSAQIGEDVGFKVETTIPSYSSQYTSATFKVSDTLDAGLTAPDAKDVTVKVGGKDVAATNYTVEKQGNGFVVTFTSNYILGLCDASEAERKVEITYEATVNNNAKFGYVANKNTATIEYSNNPNNNASTKKKSDDSNVYTFGLDANLNGNETTNNIKTHEVVKLDADGSSQTLGYENTNGTEVTVTKALKGAVFGLYSDSACKNLVKQAETSGNGYMEITGLKEGTYYLKEISAPSGYVPRTDVSTAVISAVYNNDGTLSTYTVNITDSKGMEYGSTYTATYKDGEPTITVEPGSETLFIVNTKISGLPSTGGMGTYVFIVLGTLAMVYAAISIIRRARNIEE